MVDDDECQVGCGKTRAEHANDDVHHTFSEDGQLRPKPKQKASNPLAIAAVREPLAARLVALLLDKGVLDSEDVVYLLTGGGSRAAAQNTTDPGPSQDSGDSSDRATATAL